jgi:hypothetical protein
MDLCGTVRLSNRHDDDVYNLNTTKWGTEKVLRLEQGIFVSSQSPDRLWDPLTLPVDGCRGYFSGTKWPGRDVAHLHLEPRLTVGGLTHQSPFPYASMAWAGTTLHLSCNKLVKVKIK